MSLTCSRCQKVCKFPWELKRHLVAHLKTDKKKYTGSLSACSQKECGKTYACKQDLKKHQRIHTDKALVCHVDTMKFATKQALQEHMIIHSGEKPFQCALCGNTFGQPANMRTHVKNVHKYSVEMNRANKCEYCGRAQSSLVNLHHHLLEKHTDQVQKDMEAKQQTSNQRKDKTPVGHNMVEIDNILNNLKGGDDNLEVEITEYIPSELVVPNQLEMKDIEPEEEVGKILPEWELDHKFEPGGGLVMGVDWDRAPSSGRFYTCEQCRKAFGWRFEILFHGLCHLTDDLGQAMNRTCPECETTFKAASGLKVHLIVHTREMPFLCIHCGKSLNSLDLKVHIESEHFVTPGQTLVVQDVKMRREEVEETRKQVVLGEGIRKTSRLTGTGESVLSD